MIRSIIVFFLLGLFLHSSGQTQFLFQGKIEYERKINVHRQFDVLETDTWYKEYLSKLQKFHTTYFDLYFSETKTIFKPGKETDDIKMRFWGLGPSKDNIVVNDISRNEVRSRKNVFEETYLLQDSATKLQWRISDEMRTIAGFECRKAIAKICDSVYVVAFYTDEIAVSGGPESFYGLPGMILGLAIPRLYTTWFATKIELITPSEKDFSLPTRGKKVNHKDLLSTLQRSLKDWGKEGQKNIWWVML